MRETTDTAITWGLVAVAVLLRAPLVRWGLNLGDEGMFVEAVERIRAGEVLYRDVHRTYAPGVYYPFVPLFAWLGPGIVLARAVWLCMLAALAALTFRAARPWAGRWAAAGAGLLPLLVAPPAHKTFVPLSVVCGLLLCRRLLVDVDRKTAIAIGAGIGGLGLLRQEVALYALAIAVLTLLARRSPRGRPVGLLAGVLLVWGPVTLMLAAAGAVPAAFRNLVIDPPRDNRLLWLPFPSPARMLTGPDRLEASLFWFPLAIALASAVGLWTRHRRGQSGASAGVELQWILMALFTLSIVAVRSDLPHLTQALVAPSLLLALFLTRWWTQLTSLTRPRRWGLALSGALISVWALAVMIGGARNELLPARSAMFGGVRFEEPPVRVILPPEQAAEMHALLAELRSRVGSGEPVFIAPHAPMLYFLGPWWNPTPYDMVIGAAVADTAKQREIVALLEEAGVTTLLYDERPLDGDPARAFPENVPVLEAWLARSWVEDRRVGSWVFLRRAAPDGG